MIKEMHSSERLSILWKLDNIYLPIRRNEAALFVMKLLGSTFHIWKSNLCNWKHNSLEQKWLPISTIWKMKKALICKTNRKTFRAISCQFEQQPEEKALFKSKFSHEMGEMKKKYPHNSANDDCLSLKSAVNHKQQDILLVEYYRVRLRKIHIVRHVQNFCWFWEYFQWNKYRCFGFISLFWTELPFSKLLVCWALFLQKNQLWICLWACTIM